MLHRPMRLTCSRTAANHHVRKFRDFCWAALVFAWFPSFFVDSQPFKLRFSTWPARPLRQPLISLNRMVQPAPQAPAAPKWSYEEWMKLVADRKINASNTWNLGLIDYFHEGEFLRDGDSINFQKASGTLDGCVVIYSSRVDSVDSETRALLNGLFDSGKGDDADSNDEDGHSGDEVKKKRQAGRVGATLEKDPTALDIKKIDREYLIDPLFKKTSADFALTNSVRRVGKSCSSKSMQSIIR
ncbi:condensin complex subunit 2-domain-containing protein [Zopfochytrium polystomum]|nr:condensin complex subunit 2-domain-containing protein [Zopfochytrium polystomum]